MYKRVLIKLSGEALSSTTTTFNTEVLNNLAKEIKEIVSSGVQVAIVVGGGNFIRGKFASELQMDRVQVDSMGMLATVINALAIQGALEQENIDTRVQTAISIRELAEPFIVRRAIRHLEKNRVLVFGAGTGCPFFTTDTTAALRASEIKADVILVAKNGVDGVYSDDPKINPNATKYDHLTFDDIIKLNLKVMDTTAITMCRDNDVSLVVFNMNEPGNLVKAVQQKVVGTIIDGGTK